jgi:hypothetical protein
MQVRIELILTSALLLTEVRIFSGPYLEGSKTPFLLFATVKSTVGNKHYAKSFYYRARLLQKKVRIFFYISCSVRSNRRWK